MHQRWCILLTRMAPKKQSSNQSEFLAPAGTASETLCSSPQDHGLLAPISRRATNLDVVDMHCLQDNKPRCKSIFGPSKFSRSQYPRSPHMPQISDPILRQQIQHDIFVARNASSPDGRRLTWKNIQIQIATKYFSLGTELRDGIPYPVFPSAATIPSVRQLRKIWSEFLSVAGSTRIRAKVVTATVEDTYPPAPQSGRSTSI